jgi:hypothetical protein
MNVTDYDVYTPKNIFNKAGTVINYIVKLGNVVQKSQISNQEHGTLYFETTPNPNNQQPTSSNYQL